MIYDLYYPVNINLPVNDSCIGNFDGVHLGHQHLIKETIKFANIDQVSSCVIMFDPDVHNYFSKTNDQITTIEERIKIMTSLGIDNIIIIHFNNEIANLSKEEFISNILNKLNINRILCGFDFTFGKNASGNIDYLKEKMNLTIVDTITYNNQKISSSNIKKLLKNKENLKANTLLGK